MRRHGVAHFAVSVPNVSHSDVASKLLAGRWDVTRSGLLDHTHLRFSRIDRSLPFCSRAGCARWRKRSARSAIRSALANHVGAHRGDDATRCDAPPLGALGDGHGSTYQFIRLYAPDPALADVEPTLLVEQPRVASCFLSVIVDPRFDPLQLDRLRRQLDAQTSTDFELLGGESDRHVTIDEVVQRAHGEYAVIVEPSDEIEPDWVARFRVSRS